VTFNYLSPATSYTPIGRWYHTPIGVFPSITTVLGATAPLEKKQSLDLWRDGIGHEAADEITVEACRHGTAVHALLEQYVLGQEPSWESYQPKDVGAAKNIRTLLKKNLSEVWGVEAAVWSAEVFIAGRFDLVGVWNNVPSIVDFKTARRPKTKDEISEYFMQLCFYAQSHNELFGTNIKQGVVLMAVDGGLPLQFRWNLSLPQELRDRATSFWEEHNQQAPTC